MHSTRSLRQRLRGLVTAAAGCLHQPELPIIIFAMSQPPPNESWTPDESWRTWLAEPKLRASSSTACSSQAHHRADPANRPLVCVTRAFVQDRPWGHWQGPPSAADHRHGTWQSQSQFPDTRSGRPCRTHGRTLLQCRPPGGRGICCSCLRSLWQVRIRLRLPALALLRSGRPGRGD